MAFARPTLPAIVSRVEADFVSRLSLSGAPLRRSMVRILARVLAGAAHMLHGHLEYLGRQIFPDQSDDAFLIRQASLYRLAKNPPTFAYVPLSLTGTVEGTEIPEGTVFVRSDGALYEVVFVGEYDQASATIASGAAAVMAKSVLAGAAYTCEVGQVLTFQSPIAGVSATGECTEAGGDGSDEEDPESLRARLLARLADPPQGGTAPDYVAWAKLVTGVTRVWVSPLELGPGTVVVRFVRDGDVSIFPDTDEVTEVQTQIDAKKPVHARVTVAAPIADTLSITSLKIEPNTAALQTAITSAVADLILRRATPQGTTIYLSEFQAAIGSVPGLTHFLVETFDRTSDDSDQVFTLGSLPVFGSITFGGFP